MRDGRDGRDGREGRSRRRRRSWPSADAPPQTSRRLLWAGVVIVFGALLTAAIHFAFGAWAWSAGAFFGVAALLAMYFGITACGPWTETPLLEMARPKNRRYFGGSGAIGRHLAFLALWSCAIGIYTLVLVYALRAGIVHIEGQWVEHFGGDIPDLNQPGGRLGLTIIVAFTLCRGTIRAERVAAAQRGEELAIDDGSLDDDETLKHKGLLRLALVRLMIVFLVPIYKELRRKTGLMESAAHALLMREFGYAALMRAGYVLIERQDHRAIRELREHLSATRLPDEPEKEVEIKAGLVASALYQLDGYYGARDRIRAYTANIRMLDNPTSPNGVRAATRHMPAPVDVPLYFACEKHGSRHARLVDYRADARGLGLLLERCSCLDDLERTDELRFELNHKPFVGEVRHRTYRSDDDIELRVGLQLQEAVAQAALKELQRCVQTGR